MHLIIYKSDYCGDPDKIGSNLVKIRVSAKTNNQRYHITGVLFYDSGKFIQALEGEEQHLRTLMKKITNDSRHKNIQYLVDSQIAKRSFQDWNMDTIRLNLEMEGLDEFLADFRDLYTSTMNLDTKSFVRILSRFLQEAKDRNLVNTDV